MPEQREKARRRGNSDLNAILRALPSVEEVLESPEIKVLDGLLPRSIVLEAVRDELQQTREAIRAEGASAPLPSAIAVGAAQRAARLLEPSLRRVVNASGVIIHTNLGRSVLAESAVAAVNEVARGYSTLEYDVAGMRRGSRHVHCERLICALTGAEAAIAVNNNAAAVMLVLSEFAAGHEAIVSRGELVEIGGSFRIPDIMEQSSARMVEVGTTNKTHPSDYERAVTDNTAMLLKVHTSNYRLIGFTESVEAQELRRIADEACEARRRRKGSDGKPSDDDRILVYEDLGSGALTILQGFGENAEPTAGDALSRGCDLVSFSGDKLLGGPQAGIVIGSKPLIDRLKANPLARALRLDKITLAALEETLRIYLDPERARREIPTLRMLETPAKEVRLRAEELASRIKKAIPDACASVSVEREISRAGGGALPMRDIDTFVVRLTPAHGTAQACEEHLVCRNPIPIVARVKQESILFDARTLLGDEEMNLIAAALAAYFNQTASEEH